MRVLVLVHSYNRTHSLNGTLTINIIYIIEDISVTHIFCEDLIRSHD